MGLAAPGGAAAGSGAAGDFPARALADNPSTQRCYVYWIERDCGYWSAVLAAELIAGYVSVGKEKGSGVLDYSAFCGVALAGGVDDVAVADGVWSL